ncbi:MULTISPECIES: hypothetical protein [unclassified Nonomuraea]|uniref:hypothetical protein n=1 Tax=unclassified Nonomuraea TaxID=2593643 RepID=UPI0033E64AD7
MFTIDILRPGEMDIESIELGDSIITLPDGTRFSACMMTREEVARILEREEISGQSLGGSYLCLPDLVIIKNKGASAMVDVVRDIVNSGDIAKRLPRIGEDDELDVPVM